MKFLAWLPLISSQGRGQDQALSSATGRSERGAGNLRVWQPGRSHQLLWKAPSVPQNETTLSYQWGHTGEDRHCCEYLIVQSTSFSLDIDEQKDQNSLDHSVCCLTGARLWVTVWRKEPWLLRGGKSNANFQGECPVWTSSHVVELCTAYFKLEYVFQNFILPVHSESHVWV